MRHLIDIMDLTPGHIERLLSAAEQIAARPADYREVCSYKKLATLFFEPSTRTRLSFEAAMVELGGSALGFSEAASSSASKGE
ncbi:MAG: aspartate carbamoyltransferase, partial [Clostridiales bacterium]|nr:aspartate carbamoyltransferase [Clostridiales bacterium]